MISSGDVLEIDENGAEVVGKVPAGSVFVDGLGVGDVGNIVMRDRQHLAEDGIIIVVLTLQAGSGQLLAGPDIVSRGFVYVRGSESLMDEAQKLLNEHVTGLTDRGITDWGKIKTEIKDSLGEFVWKKTKRRPMIIRLLWKCKRMELKTSIEELKQSLLESEAFLRYQKVRAEVHNYPEKEYRLHEFRRKNYFLQNSKEQLDLFTEEGRLEQEYADVYKDPLLGEYLAAEVAVCRIIQQVNKELIRFVWILKQFCMKNRNRWYMDEL